MRESSLQTVPNKPLGRDCAGVRDSHELASLRPPRGLCCAVTDQVVSRRMPSHHTRLSITTPLSSMNGGGLAPLRIQGQSFLQVHQIKEVDDALHLPQEVGGGTVLTDVPKNTLRQ